MGRASNRKKAQRKDARRPRQVVPVSRTSADPQQMHQAMRLVVNGLQAMIDEAEERKADQAAASSEWCSGREPVPAEAPAWPDGSLGDRFFTSTFLGRARHAPCLVTAVIPDVAVITRDPEHWSVAAGALVRAVVFDRLTSAHPAVSMLLKVLGPIAEAELAYTEAIEAWLGRGGPEGDEDKPDFPEFDGPVFLLGTCALVDAVWAAVGEDSLSEVTGVLLPVLDNAVPGVDGQDLADALIGALACQYRCEQPGDAEVLEHIGRSGGNALENLVAAGVVSASDVLRVGLMVLSALAALCRSSSASLLHRS